MLAKGGFPPFPTAGGQGEELSSSAAVVATWARCPAGAAVPGESAQGAPSAGPAAAEPAPGLAQESPRCLVGGRGTSNLQDYRWVKSGIAVIWEKHNIQLELTGNGLLFCFFFPKQNFISAWLKAFCSITTKCFRLLVWGLLL